MAMKQLASNRKTALRVQWAETVFTFRFLYMESSYTFSNHLKSDKVKDYMCKTFNKRPTTEKQILCGRSKNTEMCFKMFNFQHTFFRIVNTSITAKHRIKELSDKEKFRIDYS